MISPEIARTCIGRCTYMYTTAMYTCATIDDSHIPALCVPHILQSKPHSPHALHDPRQAQTPKPLPIREQTAHWQPSRHRRQRQQHQPAALVVQSRYEHGLSLVQRFPQTKKNDMFLIGSKNEKNVTNILLSRFSLSKSTN